MDLKKRVENYKRKGLLSENKRYKEIAEKYLEKARNNLIAMQVDYQVSENEDVKNVLNIADFKEHDWVVVKGYYSMYMAVLACLAKLGLKSDNHNASICALEFYFVEKGMLENNYLELLKNANLESSYIDDIKDVKESRVTAQYDVSEEFEKRKAREVIDGAKKFVDRLEKLFYVIKEEMKEENEHQK